MLTHLKYNTTSPNLVVLSDVHTRIETQIHTTVTPLRAISSFSGLGSNCILRDDEYSCLVSRGHWSYLTGFRMMGRLSIPCKSGWDET